MQYAPDGSVITPAPPGQEGTSRLPQLLSQLQGAGAGIELLDGTASEVLAAQDAQNKEHPSVTVTATVAGEQTPGPEGSQNTPPAATATRTPTPTRTPAQGPSEGSTNTPTPTATATPTPSPTPSPTPILTPTPSGPPSEGGSGPVGNPPTE